eukprot:scaffold148340_cov34-Tisochrysis_lutea.AAC.2
MWLVLARLLSTLPSARATSLGMRRSERGEQIEGRRAGRVFRKVGQRRGRAKGGWKREGASSALPLPPRPQSGSPS